MTLSKSDYILFLKHPAWLWLKKNNKSILPPIDANTLVVFDAAKQFETYAQALFPCGKELGFNGFAEYEALGPRTRQALADGHTTLFQAKFQHQDLVCIVDVLVLNGKNVELYEIKASTSVKDDHLFDLAFQAHVLTKCGFTVTYCGIIHVNINYIREGEINAKELTSTHDVTARVEELTNTTERQINRARSCIRLPNCPDISPSHCRLRSFHDWLPIYFSLVTLPADSIYGLCRLDAKMVGILEAKEITSLSNIGTEIELHEAQRRQLEAQSHDGPQINMSEIAQFLARLQFPLYFFDYETCAHTIPLFNGTKPYQQVACQYSLHVLRQSDAELEHYEYIHTSNECPAEALTNALKGHIGSEGSIMVWYQVFEKSRNTELGELLPESKEFYATINKRIVDLMLPFQDGHYADARFMGSSSIKKVLPVLVPELSYKELDVQEGLSAQRLWMEAVHGKGKTRDNSKLFQSLLQYCQLDTLAMVRIYQHLCSIC